MAELIDAVNGLSTMSINENSSNATETFFEKLEAMNFNLEELKTFLTTQDNLSVAACAGAGKTTALILRILYDYIQGKYYIEDTCVNNGVEYPYKRKARILVSTFLKTGAEDISKQFDKWCQKLGISGISKENITFTTLHAEFYGALRAMGVTIQMVDDPGAIVRQCMKTLHIRNVVQKSSSLVPTIEEVSDVEGIFSYYRNRLDATRYKHPLMADYAMDATILDTAVNWYKNVLNTLNKFDFEVLEESLLEYMHKNAAVWQFLANRYDYIYLDEFQDVSQLQYAVLQPYLQAAKQVIVIGDDDQCIYGWRGSDNNIIVSQFTEDYKPTKISLTVNYRCGANILSAVAPSIEKNTVRIAKDLRAYTNGGTVRLIADAQKNPAYLLNSIIEDIGQQKTVAILSRTNADLLLPAIAMELFQPNIKYTISKGISLGNKLPRMIFGVMDLLTKGYNEDYNLLLKGLFTYKQAQDVTKLCNLLSNNTNITIFDIPIEDYYKSLHTIAPFMSELIHEYGAGDSEGLKKAYKYLLMHYITKVFVKDSSFHIKGRDLAWFVYYLIESDYLKDKDFAYLERLFNLELPQRLEQRIQRNRKLHDTERVECVLSTVHDSKGKEWDSVYIWNDTDGTFPVKLQGGLNLETYEEERRLHYIAWTRAKEKLTVMYDSTKPSPFLLECDLRDIADTECLQKQAQPNVMRYKKAERTVDVERQIEITYTDLSNVCQQLLHLQQDDTMVPCLRDAKGVIEDYATSGVLMSAIRMWFTYCKYKKFETISIQEFCHLITATQDTVKAKIHISTQL